MNRTASYHVVQTTAQFVWIVDDDGALSVTNDAERVVAEVFMASGDRRIIYRDSDGNWDELQHSGAEFIGFAPARELDPVRVARSQSYRPPLETICPYCGGKHVGRCSLNACSDIGARG